VGQIPSNLWKKRMRVQIEGVPYVFIEVEFVKPGKGQAFLRCRLKSLLDGRQLERTFKSGESLEEAIVEEFPIQFLYADGSTWHFMNQESFEEVDLTKDQMDGAERFLLPEMVASIMMFEGKPIGVSPPTFVELLITYCEPGLKGDTTNTPFKPATLETNAVIQVPLFVENGAKIKIDTRDGSYVERVK
jgi:elongation factor P